MPSPASPSPPRSLVWRVLAAGVLATLSLLAPGQRVDRVAPGFRRRRHRGQGRTGRPGTLRAAGRDPGANGRSAARATDPDDGARRPDPRPAGLVRGRRPGRAAQPRRRRHHDRGPGRDGRGVGRSRTGGAGLTTQRRADARDRPRRARAAPRVRGTGPRDDRRSATHHRRARGRTTAVGRLHGRHARRARGPVRDLAVAGDPDAATVPRRSHRHRATRRSSRCRGRRATPWPTWSSPTRPCSRCARRGGGASWASGASRSPSPA